MKKKVILDHYEVLGLPTGKQGTKLTEKEITKAYRTKALQLHPDKRPHDPNANAEFQKLCSSYQLLMDPESRKLFDASLPKPKPKIMITRMDPKDFFRIWSRMPKPKRESPEPKKPQPKPDDHPPSNPNGVYDDDNTIIKSWLIGFLAICVAPMVHPAARSLASFIIRVLFVTTGFDIVIWREKSEYWELWTNIVAVGRFFEGLVKRNPPPDS